MRTRRIACAAASLAVGGLLAAGCGSRVDVSKSSGAPAAPASSSTTAAAAQGTSDSPTATASTTTTEPFNPVAFCATYRQIGLGNLVAFQVFEPTAAQAKLALVDDLDREAPPQLDAAITGLRDALDEFLSKVTKGEISSKAQFDDWLLHLDLTRMQHYIDGEQAVTDYAKSTCT